MGLQGIFGESQAGQAPAQMGVIPPDAVTNGRLRQVFGMGAPELLGLLARGLPGASVMVRMESDGDARIDIDCRAGGKKLFSADDNAIQVRAGIMTIAQDRDSEVRTHVKGAGFGKVFLDNMLTLAERMNLRRVDMRAGREDGAWFWSYRGGRLDIRGTDDIVYQRFERTVRENIARLTDEDLKARAEAVLAQPGADANVRLARLAGTVDGKPAGAALVANTNPIVVFNIRDAAQMTDVRAQLGDMDATRAALAGVVASVAGAVPVKAPSLHS